MSVAASNIQLWRQKCQDGTITDGELTQAVAAIRKERLEMEADGDSKPKAVKGKKAKAEALPEAQQQLAMGHSKSVLDSFVLAMKGGAA